MLELHAVKMLVMQYEAAHCRARFAAPLVAAAAVAAAVVVAVVLVLVVVVVVVTGTTGRSQCSCPQISWKWCRGAQTVRWMVRSKFLLPLFCKLESF
jgi:hypothetical protein